MNPPVPAAQLPSTGKSGPRSLMLRLRQLWLHPLAIPIAVLLLMALGYANASSHLREPFWQDEAATLAEHAAGSAWAPFLNYGSPNNHVGFSAMLATWVKFFPGGLDVFRFRMLPLVLFLGAIPVVFAVARRLGGPGCALLSTSLFANSAVAENFATQLRGYGASWLPIAACLLCAVRSLDSSASGRWLAGYAAAVLAAVAILPTNLFFVEAIALSACIDATWRKHSDKRAAWAAAALLAIPVLCLIVSYAAVWNQLLHAGSLNLSAWRRPDLAWDWLHATLSDVWWITPLIGGGAAVALLELRRRAARTSVSAEHHGALALSLVVGLAAVAWATPHALFPRSFVPFLPVWFIALGLLAWIGFRAVARRRLLTGWVVGAALGAIPLLLGAGSPGCRAQPGTGGAFDYDLCHQYFRDDYNPSQALELWASLGQPHLPMVSNYEGMYAIGILPSSPPIHEYRHYVPVPGTLPMIVAHDRAEMDAIIARLDLQAYHYRQYADTGYFKLYGPSR
jgi:hypothetical protein